MSSCSKLTRLGLSVEGAHVGFYYRNTEKIHNKVRKRNTRNRMYEISSCSTLTVLGLLVGDVDVGFYCKYAESIQYVNVTSGAGQRR